MCMRQEGPSLCPLPRTTTAWSTRGSVDDDPSVICSSKFESQCSSGASSCESTSVEKGSSSDETDSGGEYCSSGTQQEMCEDEEPVQALLRTGTRAVSISGILHGLAQHYNVPMVCVALEAPSGMHIKAHIGMQQRFVSKPSILQHRVNRALPIIVKDASTNARCEKDEIVTSEPYVRFFAEAPLMVSSSTWIGTICIADREARFLSLNDTGMLVQSSKDIVQICISLRETERDYWDIDLNDVAG